MDLWFPSSPLLLNDSPICSCVQSTPKWNSGWISKILSKGSYKANSLWDLYKLTRGLINKAYLINCSANLIYSCHLIWAHQDIYSPGCTNLKKKMWKWIDRNFLYWMYHPYKHRSPDCDQMVALFLHVWLHFLLEVILLLAPHFLIVCCHYLLAWKPIICTGQWTALCRPVQTRHYCSNYCNLAEMLHFK